LVRHQCRPIYKSPWRSHGLELFEVGGHIPVILDIFHWIDLKYVFELTEDRGYFFLDIAHHEVPANEEGYETKAKDTPVDVLDVIDVGGVVGDEKRLELGHKVTDKVEHVINIKNV